MDILENGSKLGQGKAYSAVAFGPLWERIWIPEGPKMDSSFGVPNCLLTGPLKPWNLLGLCPSSFLIEGQK
jgi:hypothetical protein